MKIRFASLFVLGVFVAVGLSAQTKASGATTCKTDPAVAPPVALADMPNHAFAVDKSQCTWTGFAVAGLQFKEGTSTSLNEITGDTSSFNGYHVATMSNGDTAVCKFQGSGKLKDGKALGGEGTWSFTSGTGKLKGIKGKGKFKGMANADGSVTYQVDGEYSLP